MLFVCIGNACRSPMAAAFANRYGSDVLTATSAGLSPIERIPAETVAVMSELDIDVSGHVPRHYDPLEAMKCDLVINMAGFNLPGPSAREAVAWVVPDPYGRPVDAYRPVRDEIEQRVMRLILDLRRRAKQTA